jgi:multiple sugar transport system ATP-binding protein
VASVTVRQVEKRFGNTLVLRGVDIDVLDGGFAVLVGPSGCGKSTLLRTLAGLEPCDAGSICFGKRDVTHLPPRQRDVAMVFQSYALYPHLSVRRNLAFGLELRKTPKTEIAERIEEVSGMLGLGELLDRLPRELSGGQRQRVAMGRAIVRRPQLFLFDEPLSNLDAALRAQVRVDIRKLHDRLGATSVYVTHDQVEAMTLADELFVMKDGRVEQSGAPLDVYAEPATRFVAAFLGSPGMNFVDAELGRDGGHWHVEGRGVRLSVAPKGSALARALGDADAGRRVVAGVRPHDVVPSAEGAARIDAVVEVVEALGSESFAHCEVAGAPFVARLEAGVRPARGDALALGTPPERVHLFDPESGRALWSKS